MQLKSVLKNKWSLNAKHATEDKIHSLYALTTWFIPSMVSVCEAKGGYVPLSLPDVFCLGTIGPTEVVQALQELTFYTV